MKSLYLVHDLQEDAWQRKQMLESAGYQVELMANGEQCLERLETGRPDLVLMDVLLEGRNGFEVCKQIRMRYDSNKLPVLLTTSVYRHERYREEARALGAQGLLLKPVSLAELTAAIQACLRGESVEGPSPAKERSSA